MRTMGSIRARQTAIPRRLAEAIVSAMFFVLLAAPTAFAGIDHRVTPDTTGIWSRGAQNVVRYGAIATEIGGALWYGGEDPLGRTFWQSIDSTFASGITVEVMKPLFGRRRPSETDNPDDWWNGRCCNSFPSGEVTLQASFVTPIIMRYAADHPWVWALEALPAYSAVARVKSGAHWQTDVLAGWAIGTGFGYWAANRDSPIVLQLMPGSIAVGLHTKF